MKQHELNPGRLYIAVPEGGERSPILFRGRTRTKNPDNLEYDDNEICSCWPFESIVMQPRDDCPNLVAIGENDNCGTIYLIYVFDINGARRLDRHLELKAAKTFREGGRVRGLLGMPDIEMFKHIQPKEDNG